MSDGRFPAVNETFIIRVEPQTWSFATASSSLTLVQGDAQAVLDVECLTLVSNGRPDTAVFRVTRPPVRGQLFRRGTGVVERFTQRQVRWTQCEG